MHEISVIDLRRCLDGALIGRKCVQVWLGYASVLFMGFGDAVLPLPEYDDQGRRTSNHSIPPYELQTYYSGWYVEFTDGKILGCDDFTNSSERTHAERYDLRSLCGKQVQSWAWTVPESSLDISFETGEHVAIRAYAGAYKDDRDVWGVRLPHADRVAATARCELYTFSDAEGGRKEGRPDDPYAPLFKVQSA